MSIEQVYELELVHAPLSRDVIEACRLHTNDYVYVSTRPATLHTSRTADLICWQYQQAS